MYENRMNRMTVCLALVVALVLACAIDVAAAVPQLINYQGRLTNSVGTPLDTTVALIFQIYADSNGVTSLWDETHPSVVIAAGLFQVQLGSVSPIAQNVFTGEKRWLGVRFSGGLATALMPLVSTAYAYRANVTDTASLAKSVADNSVTSTKILDGTITGDDIVAGTISGDKIAADAIISSRIANGSILGVDIAASQITTSHVLNGTLLGADIADGSVTGSDIADASIASADIIPDAINSSLILDGSIGTADVGDDAITSAKILNGAIGNPDIGANAVGPTTIAANAVSAGKILDEPGIAANVLTGAAIVFLRGDTDVRTILSRTIDPPGTDSGYVLAIGTMRIFFQNNPGIATYATLGVSTTAGSLPLNGIFEVSVPVETSVQAIWQTVTVHGVFKVGTNPDTFYLLAHLFSGDGFAVEKATLTLIYLPTSYGTVSVMSGP